MRAFIPTEDINKVKMLYKYVQIPQSHFLHVYFHVKRKGFYVMSENPYQLEEWDLNSLLYWGNLSRCRCKRRPITYRSKI